MVHTTILTVTSDEAFLSILRTQLHDQVGSGTRMIVTETIDEACTVLESARPRIVVVQFAGNSAHYDHMNRLLWMVSVLARRVPVLVIADRYQTQQATMLFRMGVSDYISRTHHLDQLGRVLASYFPNSTAPARGAAVINGDDGQSAQILSMDQAPRPIISRVV